MLEILTKKCSLRHPRSFDHVGQVLGEAVLRLLVFDDESHLNAIFIFFFVDIFLLKIMAESRILWNQFHAFF